MKTKRCINVNEKVRPVEGGDGRTIIVLVLFMRGGDQLMEEIKKKHKVVFLKKGA